MMDYDTAKQKLLDAIPLNGSRSLSQLWQYHADNFEGEAFWQAARELEQEGRIFVRRHGEYAGARRRDLDVEITKRLTRQYQRTYKRNLTPF